MDEKNGMRAALEAAFTSDGERSPETENTQTESVAVAQDPPAESPAENTEPVAPESEKAPTNTGDEAPVQTPPAQNMQNTENSLLRYLISENQRLQGEITRATNAVLQQSRMAQGAIDNSMNPPGIPAITAFPAVPEVPALNFEEMRYLSSEDQNRMITEWQTKAQEAMAARAESAIMSKIAPMMQDYNSNKEAAAMAAARARVNTDARFSDFEGRAGQIDQILRSTPKLSTFDPEQRYLIAGLMARGMENSPKTYTTQEIVEMATGNPEVMKALSARQAAMVEEANQNVPILSGSSGMSSAAAVPDEKPKNMDDLRSRVLKRWSRS